MKMHLKWSHLLFPDMDSQRHLTEQVDFKPFNINYSGIIDILVSLHNCYFIVFIRIRQVGMCRSIREAHEETRTWQVLRSRGRLGCSHHNHPCTIIPRVGNFTITLNLNIEKYRTNLVVIPVSLVYVSLSYLSQGYHWTPQQYAFKLSLQSARISTSDFSSNFSKAGPWGGTQEALHADLETI